jgi:cell wall-associated NlpC family hydrolase
MNLARLARGLITAAVLLPVLLVPVAPLADPTAPAGPAPSAASPTPSPEATSAPDERRPKLTRAQRRTRRIARKRRLVLSAARRQLGVRYVYGGASRGGFDCSGLTLYVYRSLGRSLPHGATDQSRRGKRVSLRRLAIGDLVFYGGSGYYHHVGIYAGRGRIIHAPRSGAVVSYARVGDAVTARRLIGD